MTVSMHDLKPRSTYCSKVPKNIAVNCLPETKQVKLKHSKNMIIGNLKMTLLSSKSDRFKELIANNYAN